MADNGPALKRHGIAVIGMGRIGNIHLENLLSNPRAHVKYVVDVDPDVVERRLKLVAPDRGITAVSTSDMKVALSDCTVDSVVICTPTWTHEDLVRKSLNAGKAVFCEKPVTNNNKRISELYDLAETQGLVLYCAFNRRFDPGLSSSYRRAKNGELGKIKMVKSCSRDGALAPIEYFKIAGGICHDSVVHDIDMVCWILGEWPETVYATAHAHIPEIAALNDVDSIAVTMKFPSGAIGIVDTNRESNYGYDQRFEVFGSAGVAIVGNEGQGNVQYSNNEGSLANPIHPSFGQRYAAAYKLEMQHFIDVIEGKVDPVVTREAPEMVSLIAEACNISIKEGRVVNFKSLRGQGENISV